MRLSKGVLAPAAALVVNLVLAVALDPTRL